ncbi:MAG: hypothetical protein GWM98_29610, partial [Nitrospinaceae bacterium]|nr:hypothetical protein [Nitrospinaceae bacterium]NIR57858.1 hypothetical protein [Nitrospinaceae bacterium]NIS88317.1 hypothetical protein [Nitrospinaceae bacterium]NIT85195.1 hypothetical protein [Nitrospinaceae bacterium]NIU47345.1 hypothetical protein [Nitrospinaceae bacterium]
VEEKEFDFYGNPGREFVIDAGFEKSRVLQRVISIDRYTYYTQLFQYPQNTDYAAWSRRFFDSFDFIE